MIFMQPNCKVFNNNSDILKGAVNPTLTNITKYLKYQPFLVAFLGLREGLRPSSATVWPNAGWGLTHFP